MKINMGLLIGAGWLSLFLGSGCGRARTEYQAIVQVSVSDECVGGNKFDFGPVSLSEVDMARQVDDLKLTEKWSSPSRSMSREEAVARLKAAVQFNEDTGGFTLRVIGLDAAECESLAHTVSLAIKNKADQAAGRQIAALLEAKQKELDATQEKLSSARKELVGAQKEGFVPSQYRLTPAYEAAALLKIKEARAEETERTNQLESLQKMEGEELRSALVKIEMGRMAAASSPTNLIRATSALLSVHQSQKSALQELESAKSGAISETNAVGHAELKLEQANRNLTNTMDACIKSIEIEMEVAKARREEMEKQLEKLRDASKRSGEKAPIETEISSLNGRLNVLTSEIEQWKLCHRILPDAIQVGPVQVEPVRSR